MPENSTDELCPNCGEWVETLYTVTGWCKSCTLDVYPNHGICIDCGKLFPSIGFIHKDCAYCRELKWQEKHKDIINKYLAQGLNKHEAINATRKEVRPKCITCGDSIRQGKFCRKKAACRSARAFHYKARKNGATEEEALNAARRRIQIYADRED